jgi:hypothetical protein
VGRPALLPFVFFLAIIDAMNTTSIPTTQPYFIALVVFAGIIILILSSILFVSIKVIKFHLPKYVKLIIVSIAILFFASIILFILGINNAIHSI